MTDPLSALEAWLSEEGVFTAARFVDHIEYDSNWRGAFCVVLNEWQGEHHQDGKLEYVGYGLNRVGGLAEAVTEALEKAKKLTRTGGKP